MPVPGRSGPFRTMLGLFGLFRQFPTVSGHFRPFPEHSKLVLEHLESFQAVSGCFGPYHSITG